MKAFVREIVARIPGLRFWIAKRIFLGSNHSTHRVLGPFATVEEARVHIPDEFRVISDESRVMLDYARDVRDDDLPVVRILSGLLPEIKTLFDFGGNVGVCFYQYRCRLKYPPELRWTVCDFPYVNEAGRKLALERGETQLAFTDDPEQANGADFYLTTGTLQYLDHPFPEMLAKLTDRPRHLLVNRVPMTDTDSFFALQHAGPIIYPYHIANHDGFVAEIEALGYKLVEQWKVLRGCDIILRPERYVRNYYGFYFVRV